MIITFLQVKNIRLFSLMASLMLFVGCHKDPDPQPDLVADLIGTYKVQKSVTILNSTVYTSEPPYLAGRMTIERSNTDKTKLGFGSYVLFSGNGAPVSEEQLNETIKNSLLVSNPQAFTFSPTQRNDTIYFTDNKMFFGSYYKDVVTFRTNTNSNSTTHTATKVK